MPHWSLFLTHNHFPFDMAVPVSAFPRACGVLVDQGVSVRYTSKQGYNRKTGGVCDSDRTLTGKYFHVNAEVWTRVFGCVTNGSEHEVIVYRGGIYHASITSR